MGLCYNIGETGSITKPLTLYLGTEILFSLAGYNGEIFHQFACDFFEQVRLANTGATPKIVLRYFADIKKEIDDFFNIACEIVEGKRYRLLDKPAMKAITNGCNTSADVDIKKSDFYHLLQFSFGIAEDPNNDYYGEEFFSSNLESFDYEDETDKDKKKELGFYLNQNAVCLRSKDPNVFSQKYLGYLAASAPFKHYIQSRGKGAANQMRIAISAIKDFSFVLPDIEVQKAVGTILSAYDDLIENNQKQIKLLEEAAQRLYKEWFVDLRFPGHEDVKIVGGVPEGWKRSTLGEIASILRRGISPKYDDGGKYLVISQKCIRRSIMDTGEARRESKEYAPELNLQDADTVICSTGTGTLGRVGQVCGTYPDTTFDSHVTLVRTENHQNFFYQAIKSQQEFLMGMGRGSTNQQELYRNVIESLQILVPTQEILNKAEKMLSSMHHKVTALNSQILLLIEVRDRLLPKLMSGELEV